LGIAVAATIAALGMGSVAMAINLDPSLSPDASRPAPPQAASGVPSITPSGHCPTTTIPPALSSNVRVAWRRFATLLNDAGCSASLNTTARRREILAMMSAQACYHNGPANTPFSQNVKACRKTLALMIQQAELRPISVQLENLQVVDKRAYCDVLAVGNVRLVPHGGTWWLTQLF
jgi:hypothetical protein